MALRYGSSGSSESSESELSPSEDLFPSEDISPPASPPTEFTQDLPGLIKINFILQLIHYYKRYM